MRINLVKGIYQHKIPSMLMIATIVVECIITTHILLQIFTSNLVAQALGVFSVIQWIAIPVFFIWFRVQPVDKLPTILEGSLILALNLATIEMAMFVNQELITICITTIWVPFVIIWCFSKASQNTVTQTAT